ncbi:hypothetical protein RJ639_042957 [Escallonia herrerae]|uniref:V-type proton ATPase subunit S1/VOA1 transmembrane domain-containing protein n=1 Tax=Escallonia herrerae TaxID=1293975 RepID=A0AA89B876_9ASTE|nr:hypothetical protein RJ639_042957 [Escallonia herrerae]
MLQKSLPLNNPDLAKVDKNRFTNERIEEAVNYQTLSTKDLAKSVMSEGGWSNLLCSGKEPQQPLDIALLLVGRELQSLDISGNKHVDPGLVDLLKVSFTSSNFSLAFPYVAASEEKVAMESSLISEFAKTCGHDLEVSKVAFSESCSVESDDFGKLADIDSVHDYLISRMEKGPIGQTNLIVFCEGSSGSPKAIDKPRSESQLFSELISSVEHSGAKYVVLYVSDPVRSTTRYPSHQQLQRFLAEGTLRNGSANSTTCDGVCQIKSSLLEGALVGIVLLVILISGLCCMMGIDTPTRFETPQDS